MNQQLDIPTIIDTYKLSLNDIANILFPNNKYPRYALDRVLEGKTNLDSKQLQDLANYLGVFVADLFSLNSWSGSMQDGLLTYTYKEYRATVKSNLVYLYKDTQLIETMLVNTGTTISEFLDILNQKINNGKN